MMTSHSSLWACSRLPINSKRREEAQKWSVVGPLMPHPHQVTHCTVTGANSCIIISITRSIYDCFDISLEPAIMACINHLPLDCLVVNKVFICIH